MDTISKEGVRVYHEDAGKYAVIVAEGVDPVLAVSKELELSDTWWISSVTEEQKIARGTQYVWRKQNEKGNMEIIAGAAGNTLTVTDQAPSQIYSVEIADRYGTRSDTCYFSVVILKGCDHNWKTITSGDGSKKNVCTICGLTEIIEPADADYGAVDAALKKIPSDLTIYTDVSAKKVKDAAAAVVRGLKEPEQSKVDAMAQAIETAVAQLEEKSADYTKVDAALKTIPADLTIYIDASAKKVTDAKNTVNRGLKITQQAQVDAMAQAIETAVAQLEEKSADYTKVDAAIKIIPADLTIYTDASVKKVTDAKNAVNRGLKITQQAQVDAMAKAIEDAVKGLEKRPDAPIEVPEANYAEVDAALNKIPADLTIYTDATVKAVTDTKNAVVRGLKETEQSTVNAMAQAIEDAVAKLEEKAADYTKVDVALSKIPSNLTIYTNATVKTVTEAKNAVVRELKATDQSKVDAMAQAIETAVAKLEEKAADYTKVDAVLKTIPANLTVYTDASAKKVTDAKNAVNRGLKITKQAQVDAMAKAIEDAVKALVKKPAAPAKLQLVAAYNGAYGIGTKWIKLNGATEYTIWQKYNGVWKPIKTVKANDSSLQASGNTLMYTDQTVKNGYGKGYIYSVSAKVGNTTVDYDRTGVAIYRLNPPTLRKATNSKAGTTTVTWKGVFGRTETNGAYDLQYATEADAKAGKWTSVPQKLGNTTTSTTITGLKKGTKYILRIRCSKTNKDRGTFYSEYSKWLSVTIKK